MEEIQSFLNRKGEEITLRPAEPDDAEGIIKALKSAAPERSYVLMEQFGKDIKAEREYISKLSRSNNLLLVGIAGDNRIIGILEAIQSDGGQRPETAHVLNIGLHLMVDFRGLGIGSRMMQYTEEWAREHQFRELETSVFTTNKRSLNLFRKAGFLNECTKVKRIRIGNEFVDEVVIGKWLD
ncbi:MAG: GNAT family N-acetyltransferase [Nitrospirae bacterium]|nr:GNAT family N-acetyltransferase [Nitrospirota bacterium]